MPKLTIRMLGVCLATPLQAQNNPPLVPQLSILAPYSPRARTASDGKTQIDAMYTYLVVPRAHVSDASPRQPDHLMLNKRYGGFLLHREEITLVGSAHDGVALPHDGNNFPDKPDTDRKDSRWVCHLPALLDDPASVSIRPSVLVPVGQTIDPVLGARLTVTTGNFLGMFPCAKPTKKTKFRNSAKERYVAQEMVWSVDVAGHSASLSCRSFDGAGDMRIDLLSLDRDIVLFFVTAPVVTMIDIASRWPNACRIPNDHHHDAEYDYEFEVLWDLFRVPHGFQKPVPQLDLEHGTRVDCISGGG